MLAPLAFDELAYKDRSERLSSLGSFMQYVTEQNNIQQQSSYFLCFFSHAFEGLMIRFLIHKSAC